MENNIRNILENALIIELRTDYDKIKYFKAKVEIVMNSEVYFVLLQSEIDIIPFKKGQNISVKINTNNELYTFTEKCSYINIEKSITIGVNFPTKINKEQHREFVRTNMEKNIIILIIDKDEKREIDSLIKSLSIDLHEVKTIDISGGGLAFYSDIFLAEGMNIMIDMEFVSPKLQHYRQKAEVIRSKEVNEKDGKFIIAATFIEMPFAVQERINHFVFKKMRENRSQKKLGDN